MATKPQIEVSGAVNSKSEISGTGAVTFTFGRTGAKGKVEIDTSTPDGTTIKIEASEGISLGRKDESLSLSASLEQSLRDGSTTGHVAVTLTLPRDGSVKVDQVISR